MFIYFPSVDFSLVFSSVNFFGLTKTDNEVKYELQSSIILLLQLLSNCSGILTQYLHICGFTELVDIVCVILDCVDSV